MAGFKIDPTRLRHIERVATRERGAATAAHDARNHIAFERHDLNQELQRLQLIAGRSGSNADTQERIGQLTSSIGELDEALAAADHEQEAAHERYSAADTLRDRCEKFLKGRAGA